MKKCEYCDFNENGIPKQTLNGDTLIIRNDEDYSASVPVVVGYNYEIVINEVEDCPQRFPIKFCPKCGKKLNLITICSKEII